ncbi:hypothetical protein RRG08_015388 [Elysia crispata]|uniref:Uncharacterized protein n=1 Tax=Elysia crispata TaxID=231223 RepID=A0AAE0Y3L8_9GAST|nr:hypothetical protein RRG08_015388 [Elysia crispata]
METVGSCHAFTTFILTFTVVAVCVASENTKGGGHWTEWSKMSECSATCGSGLTHASRTYIPGPNEPKRKQPFMSYTTFSCTNAALPVCPSDGVWTGWGRWSECTKGCGGGERTRKRDCYDRTEGGKDCEGETFDEEKCNKEPCPRLPAHFDMSVCFPATNFTCASGKMCILAAQKCDSAVQCHDGSDEMGCPRKSRYGNVRYDLRDGASTLPRPLSLLGLIAQSITCFILTATIWHN